MTLLLFVLILGLIVFIHELGHYIMAKKHGIYVYEFSLGFGPKLFSFKRKNDETEYMIRLIPLGGYVMLAGETDEDDKAVKDNQKLCNKSFFQKMSVMVAGVFNNFLLGFILIFIIGLLYGTSFSSNKLYNLSEDYPLYQAGARNGDLITKINNTSIKNYDDIQVALAIAGEGKKVNITIKKSTGKEETYEIKPKYDEEDGTYYYGISIKVEEGKGILDVFKYAGVKFVSIFKGLIIIVVSLFTGKLSINSLSGPVGVYQAVGVASKSAEAIFSLIYLTAYLSINIGFMNILPFPAFDGGQAFLLIIEKITGKKISSKVKSVINTIGFAILLLLMIYVTIKDVLRLF
jgi:regulator of sigma E protease